MMSKSKHNINDRLIELRESYHVTFADLEDTPYSVENYVYSLERELFESVDELDKINKTTTQEIKLSTHTRSRAIKLIAFISITTFMVSSYHLALGGFYVAITLLALMVFYRNRNNA
jgi:hypothetical protein